MNVSIEKITALENRHVAAQGEREGVGEIGSLGLMDANYCSWNGFIMRSCRRPAPEAREHALPDQRGKCTITRWPLCPFFQGAGLLKLYWQQWLII